jgi:FlaA1/EpsC-like NDP-sugar epimerase
MKKYLIFGGTGSLGKALIRRLIDENRVVASSRDEAKHWTIRNEYNGHFFKHHLDFRVGDIRDKQRVKEIIAEVKPNVIIVAAALKQVDTCELSPRESILTNLVGTQNVVDSVIELDRSGAPVPKTVLFVSTDKACAPVNVYGMCKAMSERYVTSQAIDGSLRTKFIGVRYGNVLESRGSIIPLFKYQGETAKSFTVTHPDMTRFLMTLDDSVDLIKTALNGDTGSIWIPRLKSMRIKDLAEIFSEAYNKPISYIGLRPGEKMHEALLNDSESVRTQSTKTHYIIGPAYQSGQKDCEMYEYTSADDVMTKQELYEYLKSLGILDKKLEDFEGKSIEELRTT